MITHFRFKPMFENTQIPGWTISFYYNQKLFNGEYKIDGEIIWIGDAPGELEDVERKVHELMLFHVYD
ncbi:DUF5342 family protein [Ureibacillus acetophenoni]|uniref:YheE family protein n=1 Tax=Ureibacillus acetophenoni TaxID=614649 RepID=A0A285UDS4_9BACL|nr:DUF5342 family protein [Ureibacillus acetophenoni]SOC40065.1 hypothetical protein SAMN05877842_10743 [Ureibacillus acetophenoni]